ncbi:nuclear transport factor 2 family protein [Streptomyces sp. NPDC014870]|uniref:nuclear transport factor 2 family protein n=1 Tax=Streptomyces sp. NPDC014870 TaxID=3364925 RepID=UPI0036F8CEAB
MAGDSHHASIPELARRIQELTDRQEIGDLVASLGRWLDDADFDAGGDLFTADVSADTPGGTARGRNAVVAQARRGHEGRRCQHFITDLRTDVRGDRASAEANFMVAFAGTTEAEPTRFTGARYHLQACREEGRWLLNSVRITSVWHH